MQNPLLKTMFNLLNLINKSSINFIRYNNLNNNNNKRIILSSHNNSSKGNNKCNNNVNKHHS